MADNDGMIRVLVVEPGEKPYEKEIRNTLEELQKWVDGYIEVVYPFDDQVCIICNEEGRLRGLPYNITFLGERFVGPVLVVGVSGEDFCDLEDAEYLLDVIRMHPEVTP